jgi:hypothetical protein
MSIEVKQMIIKSNITSSSDEPKNKVESSSCQDAQLQGEHTQNLRRLLLNVRAEPRER